MGCVELAEGVDAHGGEEAVHRGADRHDASICDNTVRVLESSSSFFHGSIAEERTRADSGGRNSDAEELVSELEFVWNQIRNNSGSSNDSSPQNSPPSRRFQQPSARTDGPMKVLSPMSEQDEAELRSQRQMDLDDDEEDDDESHPGGGVVGRRGADVSSSRWQRKVERAITSLSAEVAALREQISSGREWRSRIEKSWAAWMGRIALLVLKHLIADTLLLVLILLWMRRRKDRRLEDLVRAGLKLMREYARKVLPSRS